MAVSRTIALPTHIIPKPAFGAPCNGCGWCCWATACAIAIQHFAGARADEPCPALEFEDGRSRCGLVRRPGHYLGLPHAWADEHLGATVAELLGVGRGCDAAILKEAEDIPGPSR